MILKLDFVEIGSPFYREAVAIRVALFFKNKRDSLNLINDDFELNGMHLVCLKNNRVVGTGRLNIEKKSAVISQMAIKADEQREGIGSKIINALINKCEENKVSKIELGARVTAVEFYKKFDFVSYGDVYASKKTGIIHQQMYLTIK